MSKWNGNAFNNYHAFIAKSHTHTKRLQQAGVPLSGLFKGHCCCALDEASGLVDMRFDLGRVEFTVGWVLGEAMCEGFPADAVVDIAIAHSVASLEQPSACSTAGIAKVSSSVL